MVVMVAFAPSSQGDAALAAALKEVTDSGRELVIASHAYVDPERGLTCAPVREVREALSRVAATMEHRVRLYLETLDVPILESESKDIGEYLRWAAIAQEASLIVVALHRAGPIGRVSLGQSVRKLLTGAPCPIFVAKDSGTRVRI